MKKLIYCTLLLISTFAQAQTYLKANAITTLLTVPNVGIETSIGKKSTFQFDITASMWKSINGNPAQFYMFVPEYRYHFKEKFNGFYAGVHVGGTVYNFQKWNYWKTDNYEKGVGYMAGATIGYQKKIKERFVMDFFLGGGNHQGFYKGYLVSTGERVDEAKKYNKSGEWLPYRGGIMLSYRLK